MILINSSARNSVKMFQPFFPVAVPVGVAVLLSILERDGVNAQFIDEQIEEDMLGRIRDMVAPLSRPYIFGFSVLTASLKSALVLAKQLKEVFPDSIVLFGGIHPTAMPDEVLGYEQVDVVVRGEADNIITELYHCLKKRSSLAHLPSVSWRNKGKVVHNPRSKEIADINALPLFPYHRFTSPRYDLSFVVSSRGCPYECVFCSNRVVTGRRYRYREPVGIVNDLERLFNDHKITSVVFLDDNFLVSKERIYGLIDEIVRRGLDKKMSFSFQARADNVDPELLKDLFNAGFRSIFFGIESSSNKVLEFIKKKETVEQCVAAVKMAKEIGFHVSATFIFALPGEDYKVRMDCLRMSRDLHLDMVRFNNATPYPGTELYDFAMKEKRINIVGLYENFNSVSAFIEDPFHQIPFSYVPSGTTEAVIRRDILFSYFSFYFNIRILKNIFGKPERGVGWFNAGKGLMTTLRKVPAVMLLFFFLGVKFLQLFYYMVFKKETAISFGAFLKVFEGLSLSRLRD